jgi:hypothetical protein
MGMGMGKEKTWTRPKKDERSETRLKKEEKKR